MAQAEVPSQDSFGPQLSQRGLHADCVPGHDHVGHQVQAEDLIRLLLSLAAPDLALVGEEEEAAQGVQRFSFVQLSMDPSAVVFALDPLEDEAGLDQPATRSRSSHR